MAEIGAEGEGKRGDMTPIITGKIIFFWVNYPCLADRASPHLLLAPFSAPIASHRIGFGLGASDETTRRAGVETNFRCAAREVI
jgi:hypothetical protein